GGGGGRGGRSGGGGNRMAGGGHPRLTDLVLRLLFLSAAGRDRPVAPEEPDGAGFSCRHTVSSPGHVTRSTCGPPARPRGGRPRRRPRGPAPVADAVRPSRRGGGRRRRRGANRPAHAPGRRPD